jgi:hypothetical protein
MKSQYRVDHLFELLLKVLIAIFIFGILFTFMKLLSVQKISSFGIVLLVFAIGLDLLFSSPRIDLCERKYEYPRPPLLIILITGIAGLLFALFFLTGSFIILKQVFVFFKNGVWEHEPGIIIIKFISVILDYTALTKWLEEPESWLGLHRIIGFLNMGAVLIVLGAVVSLILCIPFFRWNREFKRLKSAKKPKINKNYVSLVINLLDIENKAIPKDVNFDEDILVVPTLNEMGVPIPLSYTPFTITYHQDLSWVEKGDPLITYYFWTYETKKESNIFTKLGNKGVFLNEFHLTSPISALLIHYRQDGARIKTSSYSFITPSQFKRKHNYPSHNGLIEYNKVAPTLLVPKGSGTSYLSTNELQNFSFELTRFIHENWRCNVHNSGQKYEYKRVKFEEVFNPEITDFNMFNCGTVGSSLNIEDKKIAEIAGKWINSSIEYIMKRSMENKWRHIGFQEYNKKISANGISFKYRIKQNSAELSAYDYYAQSLALSLEETTRNSENGDLRPKIEHLFKYIPEKPV